MSAKFEITKAKGGKFMFNLKAGNGEIILTSQMYEAKSGAEQGVASVKANAGSDERYERKRADRANSERPVFQDQSRGEHRPQRQSEPGTVDAGRADPQALAVSLRFGCLVL
jgi:uncharacterized protein YegP (UPF0339 family)